MKNNNNVAFVSEQLHRTYMEDFHSFTLLGKTIFGGVYDSHGDARPAKYARDRMPVVFKEFLKGVKGIPQEAFKKAYKKISDEMTWAVDCGTCVANFFIKNEKIYIANAGDSHIVIVGDGIRLLTNDHRVSDPDERQRVIKNGAKIYNNRYVQVNKDCLMPTRTLGDQGFKPFGVMCEPSVLSCEIKKEDRFLIAGTDGLFDVLSLEEIFSIYKLVTRRNTKLLAKLLKEWVIKRGGTDNLTIIVYRFDKKT
jgi:serine/threonine protein phosphatase PrpC